MYVRCGSYAAQHLTDGYIPESVALSYGTPALADTLVRVKLWRRTRGGWRMPDYLDYNPSKQAVDKSRKDAAERQKRSRERVASLRDKRVTSPAPAPAPKNGSVVTATDRPPASAHRKPGFSSSNGSAATRQPPPYAQAVHHALNPEDPT